ncbi:MAG: MTH1187 family thiamine-binding protein [Bacilli bacterium]
MAIIDISIVPIGTESASVSSYVAHVHNVLQRFDDKVHYQLTPMNTIIEGELDVLLAVVRQLHECPFEQGAQRVMTTIRIDDRRDRTATMEQKLRSVEEKLC